MCKSCRFDEYKRSLNGFSYDLLTNEFQELKKGEFVFKELIPLVVRHFKEEDETLERGLLFKI